MDPALTADDGASCTVPWQRPPRPASVRASAGLLAPAIRRLFWIESGSSFTRDLASLDTARCTKSRIAFAVSWHTDTGALGTQVRPSLRNLTHAGWVMREVGLIPSEVYEIGTIFGFTTSSADDALIRLAHLSVISPFSVQDLAIRAKEGWGFEDLLRWSTRFPLGGEFAPVSVNRTAARPEMPTSIVEHFEVCVAAGWDSIELRDLLRTGTPPDAEMAATVRALRGDIVPE